MTVGELIKALDKYDHSQQVVLLPDFGDAVVVAAGGVTEGWWQPFRSDSGRGDMSIEWFDGSAPVVCIDPINGGSVK